MKKQIITASLISIAILAGSFTTVVIKSANATNPTSSSTLALTDSAITTTATIKTEPIKITPKHGTIYAIANHNGTIDKTFIGNTLDANTTTLPLSLNIKYYLDDIEISAAELAGKSGHVRIVYNYAATKTYQEKLVPFVTLTGLILDDTKFTNLKLENGKIISDDNNIAIVGYSLVGLNENLGTDFLPSTFAIEADVKDFKLDTTYTIATSELFANIDTTKLTSIDDIINSINQLASGFNQIISGTSELTDGLDQLSAGLDRLADGLSQVVSLHDKILAKANEAIAKVTDTANKIIEKYNLDPECIAELTAPLKEYYDQAYTAVITYTDGIKALSDGANQLKNGADQLYDGANQLKNGLYTFKSQGLNRLVNFANQDLNNFVLNLRKTIDAANSYHSYDGANYESVKFVFKTPSIK